MFFAFDVDGTLTPSRQRIDPDFECWFIDWMSNVQRQGHSVLLVTGSDFEKTIEQLGSDITDRVDYCCNCLGNHVIHKDGKIESYSFDPSKELINFLNTELETSPYPERYGNHIEHRGSMINFSVVGRNAKGEQRTSYYEWDKLIGERVYLAARINLSFPDFSAQAGGETGIDIIPIGRDKRQVIKYMLDQQVLFFGDRLDDAGNDKPLADVLLQSGTNSKVFHVKSWNDTWELLRDFNTN